MESTNWRVNKLVTQDEISTQIFFQFRQRQYSGLKKKRLGIFHVSDYVPECARNAYYNHIFTGARHSMDTKSMSVFWAGEAVHQMLDNSAPAGCGETPLAYNFIDEKKIDLSDAKYRESLSVEEWIKIVVGEADSLYKIEIDGKKEWVIVDYKTWLSKGFKKREVSPDHKKQINIYKALMQKTMDIDVKWGAVVYLDFSERCEKPLIFAFKLDKIEETEAHLKFRYDQFAKTYKTGELPERVKSWKCDGYCPHAERCFDEDKLDREENKLVPTV